jgi:hypothetical protein
MNRMAMDILLFEKFAAIKNPVHRKAGTGFFDSIN